MIFCLLDRSHRLFVSLQVLSIMKWFLYCFKHYADFKGRARRKEYWFFSLTYYLIVLFFYIALGSRAMKWMPFLQGEPGDVEFEADLMSMLLNEPLTYILGVIMLVTLVPSWAVMVRRLHDIGRSGYWAFLFVGLAAFIQLFGQILPKAVSGFLVLVGFFVSVLQLVWLFTDSAYGPNKYGLNPKGEGNPENQDSLDVVEDVEEQ